MITLLNEVVQGLTINSLLLTKPVCLPDSCIPEIIKRSKRVFGDDLLINGF